MCQEMHTENVGGSTECETTNLGFRPGFKFWIHHVLAVGPQPSKFF